MGHDRDTEYAGRQNGQQDSLTFINSDNFDVYCGFIGFDANNWRRLTRKRATLKLADKRKFMAYQIEMECV